MWALTTFSDRESLLFVSIVDADGMLTSDGTSLESWANDPEYSLLRDSPALCTVLMSS